VALSGIIVSINFNITHLRATLNDYPWSANVALQYRSLKQFQFFRWAFLIYLLLPTLLLIVKIMLLSWAYNWLDSLLHEAAYLLVYVAIAISFGPTDRDQYVRPFVPPDPPNPQQQEMR
jgi:membrane protein required for beta-lactamase induction